MSSTFADVCNRLDRTIEFAGVFPFDPSPVPAAACERWRLADMSIDRIRRIV